jgi:photosystem II stability/assembly factor-like uncharacterized protein
MGAKTETMRLRAGALAGLLACAAATCALFASLPAAAQQDAELTKAYAGMKWRLIGPYRGGRVLAVSGIPGDPNVYYFGAVAGGVWKTTDAGSTWQPIFDKQPISSIGSIAVAESDPNVIFVGTGEACIRGNISFGDGVYKSTDGGKTWQNVGLRDTRHIGRVIVHPRNPDIVFVAALGHAYGPNQERGIFRSTDGGKTWEKVLYQDEKTGGIDIEFDRTNPRILLAALWEAYRTPWSLTSGGPGSGLYRSTDGGTTWKRLEGQGLPKGPLGRIGVRVSPADSNRIYALIEAEQGGLYLSEDGGDTWKLVNDDHRFRQRAWYYTHVFADPKNAATVYILNTRMYRSTDGGQKFTQLTSPHGDHHGLWIDPTNPQRMINGNDGGATISVDGGKSWTLESNQPTAQFYHVITDNRFPYYVYGAQQDNSTVAISSRSDHGYIDRPDWYPVGGGESGYIAPDPRDPNVVYAGSYMGYVTRFDKRTGQVQTVSPWPEVTDGSGAANLKHRFQWTEPIVISPHDPNVLYHAAEALFKSTNGGMSWTAISGDLTRNDKSKQQTSGGPITKEDTGVEYYDVIFAVAESPVEKDLLWVGTDDGLVHLTRDGGQNWAKVTPREMPQWSMISLIDPSPHDAAAAYIAVDRHKFDDFHPYVYKTSDFGKSWTKITGGLPENAYVHAVREDPKKRGLLYTGTEIGIFVSFDDGGHWQPLKLNLPVTPIHDLVVHGDDLVVATHGRSFWILDDLTPLRQFDPSVAARDLHLYAPQVALRTHTGHAELRGRPVGENPPNGAILYYYLKAAPKEKEEVTLEIRDAQGQLLRKYSSRKKHETEAPLEESEEEKPEERLPAEAGTNRFTWDLRYEGTARIPGYSTGEYDDGLRGPLALPGKYSVRLNAAGKSVEVPLEVRLDPRVRTSQVDLEKQFELRRNIQMRLTEISDTVNQIRDLRAQLQALRKRLGEQGSDGGSRRSLTTAAEELEKKVTPVEEELIQVKLRSSQDSLNYPLKVDGKLAELASFVESADAAPTQQSSELFEVLSGQVAAQLAHWNEIAARDTPAFNDSLRKENIPLIWIAPASAKKR